MSALVMSPALIADRIDGFLFCNERVNRDVAVYVKCIHLTWVPSMEVNTAAFHTCLCKYFSGKMGTRHVCVCVYVNALVINVRLQQHMCEVICLLWQWLMYMFSRKWLLCIWKDWIELWSAYSTGVFSQKMILIWLTCIQDYIILLLSELTALRSHFLCQKLEYSHILKVLILLVQIMKSVGPDRRRKKSVTRKQHNIHAHYVNEEKIYILKPKKRTLSLPVQHPHMHKGTRTYTCC